MNPKQLKKLADKCTSIIDAAKSDGIDPGTGIDLCADNINDASISDIKNALEFAGYVIVPRKIDHTVCTPGYGGKSW